MVLIKTVMGLTMQMKMVMVYFPCKIAMIRMLQLSGLQRLLRQCRSIIGNSDWDCDGDGQDSDQMVVLIAMILITIFSGAIDIWHDGIDSTAWVF